MSAEIDQHLGRFDTVIAELRCRLRRACIDTVGYDDLPTFLAKTPGGGPPNALPGTGYDADFILKPERTGCLAIQFDRHYYALLFF